MISRRLKVERPAFWWCGETKTRWLTSRATRPHCARSHRRWRSLWCRGLATLIICLFHHTAQFCRRNWIHSWPKAEVRPRVFDPSFTTKLAFLGCLDFCLIDVCTRLYFPFDWNKLKTSYVRVPYTHNVHHTIKSPKSRQSGVIPYISFIQVFSLHHLHYHTCMAGIEAKFAQVLLLCSTCTPLANNLLYLFTRWTEPCGK